MNLSDTIIHGNTTNVEQRLKNQEDVNYLDEYGYTPLIQTAIVNESEKTALLLDAGADPNQKDITGRTALHWAVGNSNPTISQLLLEKGADPNVFHRAGEPVLVKPILRGQHNLKTLLLQHKANTTFAHDYIYTKLIGHRFELTGSVDIVDPHGVFLEVDYEGFYLEFCLELIASSLHAFQKNFAARSLVSWFNPIDTMINGLIANNRLTDYDHYLIDPRQHYQEIKSILSKNTLLLPVSQAGHAVMLVKHNNLFAICDRSQEMCFENKLSIYYMNKPYGLNTDLLFDILYQKQEFPEIYAKLHHALKLNILSELPMPAQKIGNCSWANVEATIPVLYWMLQAEDANNNASKSDITKDSLELFQRWKDWDKERALQFMIRAFDEATPMRKASIAALLAGVLFQRFSADNLHQMQQAEKIVAVLKTKKYQYILKSYIKFYVHDKPTKAGKNLMRLLTLFGVEIDFK